MAKRENWVRLDIAPFCMAVMANKGNLEEWTLSLADCLAYNDSEANSYGAILLGEATEYRARMSEYGKLAHKPRVAEGSQAKPRVAEVPPPNTSNDVLSCTVESCTDKEKEELRKEWNNSNPARGIGEHDDHGNQNGTGTGAQRHADGGRASGASAGGRGSSHEPSQSHSDHSDSNKGSGSLPHRQPEPAQTEPSTGSREQAPLTAAGCGLAPLRRPLGTLGDSQPLPQGYAGDHRHTRPAHALGDTQYPIDVPACGGPDATTNAIAPLDGVAAGQQTANRGAVGLFDANPAGSIREAPKAGTNGKSVAKRGNAVLLSESESALAVWKAFPSKSRERSSPTQFRKTWNEQRKLGLPSIETLIDAVQGWAQSEKWSKDNGQYQEGAHRWLAGRQWENLPDRLKTFEEQMAAELEATNERFRELGCEC